MDVVYSWDLVIQKGLSSIYLELFFFYFNRSQWNRGAEAVSSIQSMISGDCEGSIELVTIDVGLDASVAAAAEVVTSQLGSERLYAIVNNAGLGPQTDGAEDILNVNFYGPKRVIDAFGPLLRSDGGRIVNVGSGAGPSYVKNCPPEVQKLLCNEPDSWEQIVSWASKSSDGKSGVGSTADSMNG